MPTGWGGRSQEDHQSLPLNAKLAGRPSATGSIQRTARGVSMFPVGQVSPDGASICLVSYRAVLDGRRQAGSCWDGCPSACSLVDVSPGWWPSVQASDLEATRLSTAGPGHHLPEAASSEGQPDRRMGQGLSSTAHAAWMANSCSPATEPLVLKVVLEDTVQNQKHS